jgi:hypothetical protein
MEAPLHLAPIRVAVAQQDSSEQTQLSDSPATLLGKRYGGQEKARGCLAGATMLHDCHGHGKTPPDTYHYTPTPPAEPDFAN